jgi:hypothetical protein
MKKGGASLGAEGHHGGMEVERFQATFGFISLQVCGGAGTSEELHLRVGTFRVRDHCPAVLSAVM